MNKIWHPERLQSINRYWDIATLDYVDLNILIQFTFETGFLNLRRRML
jgi:hypothetical protein